MQWPTTGQRIRTMDRKPRRLPPHIACSAFSVKASSNGQSIWIDFADRMKDIVYLPSPVEVGLLSLAGGIRNLMERTCLHEMFAGERAVIKETMDLVNGDLV